MPARTLVSFHAHPDDEALLTGGTLAHLSAQGHRVVIVVATDGEAGLAAQASVSQAGLGTQRVAELYQAAQALGVAAVERLGWPDSGWRNSASSDPQCFSRVPAKQCAIQLAEILRREGADALTTYDPAGGYGHPDHRQVHRVGALAALAAGTPVVLQATVPRERIYRLVRWAGRIPGLLDSVDPQEFAQAFTPRAALTHRIDVRAQLPAKMAAMAAHASQASSDVGPRTLALLLRLPPPIQRLALGYEWFVQPGKAPGRCPDVFADLDIAAAGSA